jgi:hypothetical protein
LGETGQNRRARPDRLVEAAIDEDVGVEAGRGNARLTCSRIVDWRGGRELERGKERENGCGD